MALPAAFAGANNSGSYLEFTSGGITARVASSLKLNEISRKWSVFALDHDGPACKAGIRNNDVITSVAGTQIQRQQMLGSDEWHGRREAWATIGKSSATAGRRT